MSTYRVIHGTAYAVPSDDPTILDQMVRVRVYRDGEGNHYIGRDTIDVDYYCSQYCLDQANPGWGGNNVVLTDPTDAEPYAPTVDIEGESIPELSDEYGIDLSDDTIATEFEAGFSEGFWDEVERVARYQLEDTES